MLTREQVIARLCELLKEVMVSKHYSCRTDCICGLKQLNTPGQDGVALELVERVVRAHLRATASRNA